ncbi:ATPase [Rhodovulum sp. PH10]|uniref:helicase HerA-like domain-containing protein n=1 Tax=Rhodovulum sp. PH10 TaxID=1187851 RepID=UPI00027C25A2|nr:helicase HerA-like domain-containing protein [Rhodovulum sp. PH10]EJW13699.1 ATPase [Rhodovulum sp. PH10]
MSERTDGGAILVGASEKPEALSLALANRHGLITGATGTGKTVTLQTLAEGFSRAGVPVFAADVKGDLSGIAAMGESKPAFVARAREIGLDYVPEKFPVVFWDLFGAQGHPIRASVHELGPLLLSRMLDLNDVQAGVLEIAFKVMDEADGVSDGTAADLVDLENLRELLAHVGQNAKAIGARYGNVSAASIGAVQRQLLVLENQGGAKFFGAPDLDLDDFMAIDAEGKGRINILAADRLMQSPRLYATFLLWLVAELFERLPEVGDLDKPKLVFFFDEAHLLFDEAPKALVDRIEQVVRLIRSKGVGIYFVTQSPLDVPDGVLAQLGNRVQHALRAFTPRDQKAVKAAAETFRPNPKLDTAQVITALGKGEALVSFLEGNGTPSMVERALIAPPHARVGPLTENERRAIVAASPLAGKYETPRPHRPLDTILSGAMEQGEAEDETGDESGTATARRDRVPRDEEPPAERPGLGSRLLGWVGAVLASPLVGRVATQVARTATREAMRGMGLSRTTRRAPARYASRRRSAGDSLADLAGLADLSGAAGGRGLFDTAKRPRRR